MMKKLLSILLIAALLIALSGCKPANEPAQANEAAKPLAAGRYVESEVALPPLPEGLTNQMLLGMRQEADGGVTAITATYDGDEDTFQCRYFRHMIAADGTAATAEESWLSTLAPQGGNELHVSFAADDTLYMIYSDYDDEGNSRAHILVSRDGGKTGAELTGDGIGAMGMVTSIGVLGDGRIAAANFYDGTLLLLDAAGNRQEAPGLDGAGRVNACAAGGDYIAYALPDSGRVCVYHAGDKTTADYAYDFSERSMPQLAVDAAGTVYLADSTGVYRHAAGGTLWEKLVEGATSTLGLPSFYGSFFSVKEDGAYPAFTISDGTKLLTYRYDANMTATADKKLSVFSLRNNDTVRQAIVAANRTHGDVEITYTVAMENVTGGTEQDYIKALNTELLAGTGPDILILDGLPVDSYVEKDVLTDLTAALADTEAVLPNIAAAYAKDGQCYAVPTGFTAPLAAAAPGNENAFASLAALADAAEAAGETPFLSPCAFSYKTLARCLIEYYGDALQTGDAASVTAFLTDAKRICDATGCTDTLGVGWDALRDMSQDEMYEMFSDYFGSPQIFAAASGNARAVLMQPVGSVIGSMEFMSIATKLSAPVVSVAGQYVPVGVVGVNKATAEPEAAAAFLTTLLSYDAQGGNQYVEQFPVNARALAEMLEIQNDGVSSGFMLNDGTDFTSTWPTKAQRDALGTLIGALTTPIAADAALTNMLLPAVEGCLSGASTVAEANEQITSLLATYLSE